MKAIVIHEHGGIDTLRYEDVATPETGPGQVLVRIHASGVNHLDHDVREGLSGMPHDLPHVLGSEGVGEIAALGPGVDGLAIGDRVWIDFAQGYPKSEMWLAGLDGADFTYGRIGGTLWGTHAEYTVSDAHSVMPLPAGLSYEKAAAAIITFGTAWHMTVALGRVQAGQHVLVNAAGSGVGSTAIQVARLHGATVIASAGTDAKLDQARKLGTAHVINYGTQSIRDEVARITAGRGVELVIECVGGDVLVQSIDAVGLNGSLITCGAHAGEIVPINIIEIFRKHMRVQGSHFAGRREVAHVLGLIAEGRLEPVIFGAYPLEDAPTAARHAAERSFFGKMVLLP